MTRYDPHGTDRIGGRLVARVYDRETQRVITVYRRGRSFLYYGDYDRLVRDKRLRRAAEACFKAFHDEHDARRALA